MTFAIQDLSMTRSGRPEIMRLMAEVKMKTIHRGDPPRTALGLAGNRPVLPDVVDSMLQLSGEPASSGHEVGIRACVVLHLMCQGSTEPT